MNRLLAALLLTLACGNAFAQGSGSVPLGSIPIGRGPTASGFSSLAPGSNGNCVQVVGGAFVSSACPAGNPPAGSSGQIQYNNAGAFGGFTAGGDLTFAVPNFTIGAGKVGNTKLATGAANTIKGSLNGTTTTDLAVPSCTTGALQYTSGTGLSCGTISASTTAVTPTTATVTISNASPAVITWTAHGLTANAPVFFCTTGSLPTGLSACVNPVSGAYSPNTYTSNPTLYYVVGPSITANTFQVSATVGGAAVNTSSAGSGTQTAFANALACTGCVGETIWHTVEIASAFALTSGSAGQVWNTITLTAGAWEVWGNTGVIKTGGTTPVYTHMHAGIVSGFSTIPTSPFNGTAAMHVTSNDPNGWEIANSPQYVFLTGTTTMNAVITSDFTGGTAGAYGTTWARRIR